MDRYVNKDLGEVSDGVLEEMQPSLEQPFRKALVEKVGEEIKQINEKAKIFRMSRLKKSLITLLGTVVTYAGTDLGLSIYRSHRDEQTLQALKIDLGLPCYSAGMPGYHRNFSRDALISGLISNNLDIIVNQLKFSALKQGVKRNSSSGEEPGKIHHEFPSVGSERGTTTEYAACDTTALFLMNHQLYQELTGDKSLAESQRGNIERAASYIISHLDEKNRFIEDPKFCGGERFGLVQTYWKDGGFNPRSTGFPIIYPLAHIQNMAGLRAVAKLLDSKEIEARVEGMKNVLPSMYDEKMGIFYFMIGQNEIVRCVTDDPLQSMFYLEPGDFPREKLERIVKASEVLETPWGYRLQDPVHDLDDAYRIFPFAQAIIHKAGIKHGFPKLVEVSARVVPELTESYPEYLHLSDRLDLSKGYSLDKGDNPQLWTVAAALYFEKNGGFFHRMRPEHHLRSLFIQCLERAKKEYKIFNHLF